MLSSPNSLSAPLLNKPSSPRKLSTEQEKQLKIASLRHQIKILENSIDQLDFYSTEKIENFQKLNEMIAELRALEGHGNSNFSVLPPLQCIKNQTLSDHPQEKPNHFIQEIPEVVLSPVVTPEQEIPEVVLSPVTFNREDDDLLRYSASTTPQAGVVQQARLFSIAHNLLQAEIKPSIIEEENKVSFTMPQVATDAKVWFVTFIILSLVATTDKLANHGLELKHLKEFSVNSFASQPQAAATVFVILTTPTLIQCIRLLSAIFERENMKLRKSSIIRQNPKTIIVATIYFFSALMCTAVPTINQSFSNQLEALFKMESVGVAISMLVVALIQMTSLISLIPTIYSGATRLFSTQHNQIARLLPEDASQNVSMRTEGVI
ncbi:MAG: hypothetical protein ACD_29C00031G0004 [uncultured bacterium]|nr:MAG: hypothetical protein ACD_29C00031G0004 [uncultured bacterium]